MTEEILRHERRGPILVITLNRPEARNAISVALMAAIADAVDEAEREPDIRVLVVAASGDRAFSAGMDLRAFADGEQGEAPPSFLRLLAGEVSVPVVAAVNAVAVGAGFELALGADVVVASSDASFGFPEVQRGLFPGIGVRHVGIRLPLGVALELTLTGTRMSAARAYECGFVNAVVAPSDVLPAAIATAERIAANAPLALAAVKELVRKAAYGTPDVEARLEQLQSIVFGSEDAMEGARAFIEKRAPAWQGK